MKFMFILSDLRRIYPIYFQACLLVAAELFSASVIGFACLGLKLTL